MNPIPPPPDDRRERAWPWLVALATAGALLGVLPHLVLDAATGDPTYVADGDGLLYLAWSRDIVRHGGWAMTDAIRRPSGPMMHPWLLFVPAAWVDRALGLGMVGLGVVWRLTAGPLVALGLFAAVRPFTRTARGAAGLAAFLLFDSGLILGQVVQREIEVLVSFARDPWYFLAGVPRLMPHLRVPTPGLALPFLLGHFALAHRARRLGTTASAVAAGLSLGLLFHVYFYFATAVAAGTALAWLLDPGGRRTYATMLGVGAVLAAPAVVAGAIIRRSTPPDWLIRTDKFAPVSRLHSGLLLLPRVFIAEWLAAAWFVFRSRRDLIYLWACAGAGLALTNQHVLTGLNIENFHWRYASGTAFSLLLAALALPRLARLPRWPWVAAAIVAAQAAVGTGLRAVEAVGATETGYFHDLLGRWRAEGFAIPPGSVVAGPADLLLVLAAFEDVDPLGGRLAEYSSATTDAERDDRDALDLALIGLTPAAAAAEVAATDHLSADSRARRLRLFDAFAADPTAGVDRFRVAFIAVPKGLRPPKALAPRLGPVRPGRSWDLWPIAPSRGLGSPNP